MGDFWRFGEGDVRLAAIPAPAKRARSAFDDVASSMAGGAYLPTEVGHYGERDPHTSWREGESLGGTTNFVRNGIVYGAPGLMGSEIGGRAAPPGMRLNMGGSGGLASYGVSALDDPSIMAQDSRIMGLDTVLGPSNGRQDYVSRQETPAVQTASGLLPPDASSTLFVEGIPADCKRREAAHIFRPFIGFKEVRLVQKEPKRPGGEQLVLCFVDFVDARCAATALEALQGYKLDESERESSPLRLQFARVLGPRGGSHRDNFGGGHDRDNAFRRR